MKLTGIIIFSLLVIRGEAGGAKRVRGGKSKGSCATTKCGGLTPKCVQLPTGPRCVAAEDSSSDDKEATCSSTGKKCKKEGEVCKDLATPCAKGATSCPTKPTCVGPCSEITCEGDAVCKVDKEDGKAVCVLPDKEKIDGCASKKCKKDETCVMQQVQCVQAPCLEQPTCIKDDPCALLICKADSKCEVKKEDGKGVCVPLTAPPAPDSTSCETKQCGEGEICKGNGKCVNDAVPQWTLRAIPKESMGENVKSCSKRENKAPKHGEKCSKKIKTCFFGNQECSVLPWFPETRCTCKKAKWVCTQMACPASIP